MFGFNKIYIAFGFKNRLIYFIDLKGNLIFVHIVVK